MNNYSADVIWSEEDECYIATIPEFPGLSGFGDTQEEAIKEANIALKSFIKVYKEDGCNLPKPYVLEPFSGQTRLRLSKSLHASLAKEAKREGVSLNTYILSILAERHNARKIEYELNVIKNLCTVQLQTIQGITWIVGGYVEHEGFQFVQDLAYSSGVGTITLSSPSKDDWNSFTVSPSYDSSIITNAIVCVSNENNEQTLQ